MKKLMLMVIIVMALAADITAAQSHIINSQTDEIIIKNDNTQLEEIIIKFDSNVPAEYKQNTSVIARVIKDGSVELSRKSIKGVYDHMIYYVPKTSSGMLYSSKEKDGYRISYNPSVEKTGEVQFAWWYLFGMAGIVATRLSQKSVYFRKIAAAFAVFFSMATLFVILVMTPPGLSMAADFFTISVTIMGLAIFLSIAIAGSVAMAIAEGEKELSLLAHVYYAVIMALMILLYFQA